jgi:hypothetical protein
MDVGNLMNNVKQGFLDYIEAVNPLQDERNKGRMDGWSDRWSRQLERFR